MTSMAFYRFVWGTQTLRIRCKLIGHVVSHCSADVPLQHPANITFRMTHLDTSSDRDLTPFHSMSKLLTPQGFGHVGPMPGMLFPLVCHPAK